MVVHIDLLASAYCDRGGTKTQLIAAGYGRQWVNGKSPQKLARTANGDPRIEILMLFRGRFSNRV